MKTFAARTNPFGRRFVLSREHPSRQGVGPKKTQSRRFLAGLLEENLCVAG